MESYLIHFFMHYVFLTHQYFMASLRPLLQFQFIRFLNVIYSLIYFCHCWIFIAALRFSLVASSGSYSPVVLRGLLLLQSAGSVVVARGLSLGYVESQFPDSGTEPTFPALWGGFLTTGPAGKSRLSQYLPAA